MKTELLPVKFGEGTFPPMTEKQAKRFGEKHLIPEDLRKAGFSVSVFRSDAGIHGSHFFRINVGKTVGVRKSA
jgi:hypothetical protein